MQDDISKNILKEIENRKAVPLPRWHFLLKRSVFWWIAVPSVIIGGISVAVTIYVFFDHDPNMSVFLKESPTEDVLLSIPYLWFLLLVLFITITFYSFRHTRKGYRYAGIRVVTIALLVSFAFGMALNTIDFGQYLHWSLLEHSYFYDKLIYSNEDIWTQADRGLLGGKVISITSAHTLILKDFKRRVWRVDIENAKVSSGTIIVPDIYLKIKGVQINPETFQASSIEVWD